MDTKKKLLLFLYKNKDSPYHIEINHIFKNCDLKPIDIQALIGDLKRNNIIETDSKYTLLGSSSFYPDKSVLYYTIDNVKLKAKLVSVTGEQYVRDNYLTPKRPVIIKIGKYILWIVGTIVTLYTFYEIIKSLIFTN